MPAYRVSAMGMSRNTQPIAVTPRCLRMCPPGYRSIDLGADAAPVDDLRQRALRVEIEPDSRRLADQILVGDVAPLAAVFAVVAIVADHQVLAGRHHRGWVVVHVLARSRLEADITSATLGQLLAIAGHGRHGPAQVLEFGRRHPAVRGPAVH